MTTTVQTLKCMKTGSPLKTCLAVLIGMDAVNTKHYHMLSLICVLVKTSSFKQVLCFVSVLIHPLNDSRSSEEK